MENIKNTALGAANTESGKTSESKSSVSALGEEVKHAQAMGLQPEPESKAVPSLDLRTEMFMLDSVCTAMYNTCLTDSERYKVLSFLIEKCTEASGVC